MLTLEDVNTINLDYVNEYCVIDTSKIGTDEFNNVLYDFCKISHSIDGDEHTFTFEVRNSLWDGGYYILDKNTNYINNNADYNDKTISFSTTNENIYLILYMCSFAPEFEFRQLTQVLGIHSIDPVGMFEIYKNEINTNKQIPYTNLVDESIGRVSKRITEGVNDVLDQYCIFTVIKSDLEYALDDTDLLVGIINKVHLHVDEEYLPYIDSEHLPRGALVDDNPDARLDIIVNYNGLEIPAIYDETIDDYCFDLDLTDKMDKNPIELTLKIYESKYVNEIIAKHNMPCHYPVADNFTTLQSLITMGSEAIELSSDITFTDNLTLPQNLYLIGNDYEINLSEHSVFIDDVNCKMVDLNFRNGNPVFVQGENSKLVVQNCSFNNASINDEYKGSVISTLNGENIVSELKGCSILNCHHSIYHHGTLVIDSCKVRYNIFNASVDTGYPAFLTMYDGTCDIANSIFDIDYLTDELCSDEIDIKFAESLIAFGEDTVFNGFATDKLSADNSLPFFDSQYNNQSHIYCKYYYPAIEGCVIISPTIDNEDKSVCHTILGNDWIFKNNVQVTRADTGAENNNRKINWED